MVAGGYLAAGMSRTLEFGMGRYDGPPLLVRMTRGRLPEWPNRSTQRSRMRTMRLTHVGRRPRAALWRRGGAKTRKGGGLYARERQSLLETGHVGGHRMRVKDRHPSWAKTFSASGACA
jgi:hypothetical protein